MKRWLTIAIAVIVIGAGSYFVRTWERNKTVTGSLLSPAGEEKRELPYEKYSFLELATRGGTASEIEVVGNKFYYKSEGRRISGAITVPEGERKGIVVMARGYVEKEGYQTGMGTKNAASYYAKQGYMTYAPDFSGYGESDMDDTNPLGARLVKPVEILDLIASLPGNVPIYLWGHSNGGQIMLTVTEILGKRGETRVKGVTLWAPVSKPFPYNILYYTDEASDSGKWLRGEIAKFEADYDVYNFSIDRYLDWINMPIQLHQGTADQEVPVWWSQELKTELEKREKQVEYYEYSGANHNMQPGWSTVVARDVKWMEELGK